jgi:phosphate-selective porin
VTLRYDSLDAEVAGVDEGTVHSWTFAFNRAVTATSTLQFEFIHPETEIMGNPDIDDDLYQIRYKVHF